MRIGLAVLAGALLAGCAQPTTSSAASDKRKAAPAAIHPEEAEPVTAVYHCQRSSGTFSLVTRTRDGGLAVFLPPEIGEPYQRLDELAAGRTYAQGTTRIVIGDRSVDLTVGERSYPGCRHDLRASIWEHAKLGGADFRGTGNEPGWVLEIREQNRLDFEYDYGAASVSTSIARMTADPARRSTRFEGADESVRLIVTLIGEICQDTMSDENFETRVVVELGDRKFQGCGRALH